MLLLGGKLLVAVQKQHKSVIEGFSKDIKQKQNRYVSLELYSMVQGAQCIAYIIKLAKSGLNMSGVMYLLHISPGRIDIRTKM